MARILNASIDTTLGGENASNEVISSQRAIKTYVDTKYSNLSYTTTCPAITPVNDIATWTVTHNLGSTNVVCSLYDSNGAEILKNTNIDSANQVTLTFNANLDISVGEYKIVVLAGGASSGGGSVIVDPTLNPSSTNPVQNSAIATALENKVDTSFSNINATAIEVITSLAMPSAKYKDETIVESGTQYTAPDDGWYFIGISTTQSGSSYTRLDLEDGFWLARNIGTYANETWIIPIRKGAKVTHTYGSNIASVRIRFYYCYNSNA